MAGSNLWWHQRQQTGGTKVFIMCFTKSISVSARGGLSKTRRTEVWSYTSMSGSAGNPSTLLRVNKSSGIHRCQPLVIHTLEMPPEPKVKCRSAHQMTILHCGLRDPQRMLWGWLGSLVGKKNKKQKIKQRLGIKSWEECVELEHMHSNLH